MRPHRVGFLRCFGLKMDIHFAHFVLELGMVFEGTTGVCFCPNLSSDNIKARSENGYGFERSSLKTGVDNILHSLVLNRVRI